MNRITLTQPEAEWLTRNVLKNLRVTEAAGQKVPELLEKRGYKVLSGIKQEVKRLDEVLKNAEIPERIETSISVRARKFIRRMIENTIKVLENVILPEYKRRDDAERLKKTVERIKLLKGLRRKLK